MNEKKFEITEEIATIRKGRMPLLLNRVSFYGREPMLDLRKWYEDPDGYMMPGKGISMSDDTAKTLTDALCREVFGFEIIDSTLNEDGSISVTVEPYPHDYDCGLHIPRAARDALDNGTAAKVDEDIKAELDREFEREMQIDE